MQIYTLVLIYIVTQKYLRLFTSNKELVKGAFTFMEKSRQSRFMQKYKINSRINNLILLHCIDRAINACILKAHSHSGTPELGGGAGGAAAPVALYQEGQGGQRFPFNLKDCLGEIASFQKL
jgi:hypothetical protein